MTTPATITDELTAADIDAIAQAIGDGFSAVNNWAGLAASGDILPDHAREYWATLPDDGTDSLSRVARVTVYRRPCGRWTIGHVDIYAARHEAAVTADDAAEIIAAVGQDRRTIARD